MWNTKFRGKFLVHAPQKIRVADCIRLNVNANDLTTGAVVGMVELYDVKRYDSSDQINADCSLHHAGTNYSNTDKAFGFMLRDCVAFKTAIPYSGKLGFFDTDIDIQNTLFH